MQSNSKGVVFAKWEKARELAARGQSIQQIADATGRTYSGVRQWANREGVEIARKAGAGLRDLDRANAWADMYRQGLTLQKIAEQFDVTREYVRQVLRKIGVEPQEGGQSVGAREATAHRARRRRVRDALTEAKWGVPLELWSELRANGTIRAFESQRNNANKRGITFSITFAQWYAVWQASGKLHLRGRGKGGYCMSRIRDEGGYSLGNVHVKLSTDNSREAVAQWKGKTKAIRGVFCLYPGRELAWLAKAGKVSLGFYASAELAGAAREAWMAEHPEFKPTGLGRGRGWHYRESQPNRPYVMQCAGHKAIAFATQEEAEAAYRAAVAARAAEPAKVGV